MKRSKILLSIATCTLLSTGVYAQSWKSEAVDLLNLLKLSKS